MAKKAAVKTSAAAPKTPKAPKASKTRKAAAPKKPALRPEIDYPREGESVAPGHYSIRITADGAAEAQARVNGGEWGACREAVGHFWFDWAPQPGAASIEVRARAGKGRWAASPARACVVA
jgi:hypothetical protein